MAIITVAITQLYLISSIAVSRLYGVLTELCPVSDWLMYPGLGLCAAAGAALHQRAHPVRSCRKHTLIHAVHCSHPLSSQPTTTVLQL